MRDGDYAIGGIHYLDLVEHSQERQISITRNARKRIENLFENAAKELAEKARNSGKGSLTERWALDYKKSIEDTLSAMRRDEYDIISGSIKKAAENGIYVQQSLFDELNKSYSLGMDEAFRNVFSKVPQQAMNELISGGIYKDGRGLSRRIWRDSNMLEKDIGYIVETALASKKSAIHLAEDLEKYVKGTARTDFDWGNCYPNLRSKKCSYEAQRLARTSINHSYQLATVRSCKDTPFILGIQWRVSEYHRGKCELCPRRAEADDYGLGRGVYPVGSVPMDHPNGMCTMIPYLAKNMDEIAEELRDWVDGGDNPALDKWFESWKSVDNTGKGGIIKEQGFIPARTLKEAEEYAKTTLGIPSVSYKGVDIETANAWNKGLKDNFDRFPELKDKFGFVGECHERNGAMKPAIKDYWFQKFREKYPGYTDEQLEPFVDKQVKREMTRFAVSSKTYAESFSPVTDLFKPFRGITVNRDCGKNALNFKNALARDVESSWHPVGCDSIRSVLDHEIGHQIDVMLDLSHREEIRNIFDSMTEEEITSNLSTYSWKNSSKQRYGEFIAEAWAEYMNNPAPRDVAKSVGEIIGRVYEGWKKKM